ncbi:MAG: hypothetical protein ABIQ53_08925 [Terracoccus sp.]
MNVFNRKVNLRLWFKVTNADEEAGVGLAVPASHGERPGYPPHGPVYVGIVEPQLFPEFPLQCGLWSLTIIDAAAWASPEPAINAEPVPVEVDEKDVGFVVEHQCPDCLPKTNRTHSCVLNTRREETYAHVAAKRAG